MNSTPTFQIVTIPYIRETDSNIETLAEKFRAFRLHSLQAAPDAFASTYEVESQRGMDQTIQRLTNPKAIQFIALRKDTKGPGSPGYSSDVDRLLKYEWVGAVVLLGPEEGSELSVPSANIDPYTRMTSTTVVKPEDRNFDESTLSGALHFHLNGMFVSPSARAGGLGRTLMNLALKRAEREAAKSNSALRVSISVFSHNLAARHLYEQAGLKVVKEVPSKVRPGATTVHMELNLAAAP